MANAAFVFFNLPGLHPGQRARVAEQIVCKNPGCVGSGLDYQFYVANTGVIGIDGVAFGLGVAPANYGAAIAGSVLTIATANGGGDGGFPGVLAGNFGGDHGPGYPSEHGAFSRRPRLHMGL